MNVRPKLFRNTLNFVKDLKLKFNKLVKGYEFAINI